MAERFERAVKGSLGEECLNLETFYNWDHVQAPIKLFARHYNERRPHSSLGYPTPKDFTGKCGPEQPAGTPMSKP